MKKALFGLLAIVALFFIASALAPSQVKVERTMVMEASAADVFHHISSLQNWHSWSPWSKLDPSIDDGGFSGPESGVGNKHCWESSHEHVGVGCQTITEIVENEKMVSAMDFKENGQGVGYFYLSEVEGGTEVRWGFESEMPFMQRIMPGLMMDKFMGPVFEQGLADLAAVALEGHDDAGSDYEIQTVGLPAAHFLTINSRIHPDEIGATLGASYGAMGAAVGEDGMAGRPTALFYSYTDTLTEMEAAMPIAEVMEAPEGMEVKTLDSCSALKIDFYGWYGDTEGAHMAMDAHMQANGLEMAGPVREVYVTDPGAEPDTTKWLTEIYYPVN